MYTSVDKAITALVMAVLSLISIWWGIAPAVAPAAPDVVQSTLGATVPEVITSALSILTPILVWLVPNKR